MPLDVSLCRCAIRVASLVAPAGLRAEWVREWNTEIWHGYASLISRGGSRAEARRKLLRFAAGAFSDVADLRRSVFNLEAALGRPGFCCALPLLVLSVVFVASHGFRYCREMIAGAPVPQPQELLLLSRSARVLGIEAAPTPGDLRAWRRVDGQFALAGFELEGNDLHVTANFYDVLGAPPHVPFRFLGHKVEAIKPLDLQTGRVGVLARLRSPTAQEQLEAELSNVPSPNGGAVVTKSLEGVIREPLIFTLSAISLTLVVGMALVRAKPRSAAFFFAKTAVAQAAIGAAWIEWVAGPSIPLTGVNGVMTAFLMPSLLLAALALSLCYSLHDQKRRCPVCFNLLTLPILIGSRSSIILDRPQVEVLCPNGHGSLLIPEPVVHRADPAVWLVLNESWESCFNLGGPK
ncbi:MAG: hypothetical protein ACLQVG_16460 [Terriglobia bacterium]